MPCKKEKHDKIEKWTPKKRTFKRELDNYGVNEANLRSKTKIICFQTFPPWWMQVSTVWNRFHENIFF